MTDGDSLIQPSFDHRRDVEDGDLDVGAADAAVVVGDAHGGEGRAVVKVRMRAGQAAVTCALHDRHGLEGRSVGPVDGSSVGVEDAGVDEGGMDRGGIRLIDRHCLLSEAGVHRRLLREVVEPESPIREAPRHVNLQHSIDMHTQPIRT
ncbi:MAG TPA: hypothetical protein VJ123_07315, partial [Anaerolineales bacterium]|nr:hypothetical protein [Anaerolineales bacterium]